MRRSIVTPSLFARYVLLAAVLLALPAAAQPLSFVASYPSNPVQDTTAVVLSADGRQVYAAGNSHLALLERSAGSGVLRFLGALDLAEVELAGEFIDLALSPDGRHLYVGAGGRFPDDRPALGVFARDTATGELVLVERQVPTAFGRRGVDGRVPLVLSPDGRHLYALGLAKQRLLVYERDPESGALRRVQELGGSGGRFGYNGLAISPEGRLVVIAGEPLLAAFKRDPTTGRLIAVGRWDDLHDPNDDVTALAARAVAFSPDGRHLYALAETQEFLTSENQVVASFDRDPVTGVPRFLRAPDTARVFAGTDLELSPDGQHLYASGNWGDLAAMSSLNVFARDATSGSLRKTQFLIEDSKYAQGSETQTAVVSPDGRHLYVGSFKRRPVAVFQRNATSGEVRVAPVQTRGIDSLGGAANVAVSSDGAHVFVGARGRLALSRFARRNAGLAFGEAFFQNDPEIDGMFEPAAVVASRDGRSLYVVGDLFGTLALFDRDPANGRLSFVQSADIEGDDATEAVLSPDDRHLYVASHGGIDLVSRDGDRVVVERLNIDSGHSLAISPDGRHFYQLVSRPPDWVAQVEVYTRNPSDGRLSLSRTIVTPSHPIQLGYDLAFDAEGRHGYLSAVLADGRAAVLAFARDTTDGGLSLIEAEIEGVGGVAGLGGSGPLAVAADGTQVFAAGSADDTLVVFSRNTANGQLQPVQVLREGEGGVSGVADLSALAAASDGRLYGVSESQSTLVVLRKND